MYVQVLVGSFFSSFFFAALSLHFASERESEEERTHEHRRMRDALGGASTCCALDVRNGHSSPLAIGTHGHITNARPLHFQHVLCVIFLSCFKQFFFYSLRLSFGFCKYHLRASIASDAASLPMQRSRPSRIGYIVSQSYVRSFT